MFSSVGLFQEIACPQGVDCVLINCIFSHEASTTNEEDLYDPTVAYDPVIAGAEIESPPAAKRRRLDTSEPEEVDRHGGTKDRDRIGHLEAKGPHDSTPASGTTATASEAGIRVPVPRPSRGPLPSTTRPVSPPKVSKAKKVEATDAKNVVAAARVGSKVPVPEVRARPKESLNPRMVPKAPESHAVRLALLKRIYESITALNERAAKDGTGKTDLSLLSDELIRLALDEEEQIAIKNPDKDLYRQVIGRRIMVLRKMPLGDWKTTVLEKFKEKYLPPPEPVKKVPPKEEPISTGLTAREEIAMLQHILTPLQGLEAHGYVTSPPTDAEIATAKKGVEAAAGFEKCDRCGVRFQVYPGRDKQGRLTSNGRCKYHWARVYRPMRQKTDGVTGPQEAIYPCCNGLLGSDGCTEAETHVYKVTETKRLASILQFERTPQPSDQERNRVPVAFDCEMGFTTLGMELIRLTAVSWPQGQELLDVLVRPTGEVLDLNTRFSGVSKEQFANAVPYDNEPSEDGNSTSEDGEMEAEPLRKVGSPAAARQLLFDLLTPTTPLIGHAIDNDLNVCRVIHSTIVDTVLLFPHPRGLPARFGLKMLTHKYFDRGIQMGGALGHDSKEDARATGDLVRLKVGEKWRQMKGDGWEFQNGRLCAPDKEEETAHASNK